MALFRCAVNYIVSSVQLLSRVQLFATPWIAAHQASLSSLYILQIVVCISEKAMAPHSSTVAWKIPWTEEPGRLQSMGSHRVGHDWSNLAAASMYLLFP